MRCEVPCLAGPLRETNAFCKQLRTEHVELFLSCATLRTVPEGQIIFHQFEDVGKTPEMFVILKGSVRPGECFLPSHPTCHLTCHPSGFRP